MPELEIGQTYYPKKRDLLVTENLVRGPDWEVERNGDVYTLEFLAARQGGDVDRYNVTKEEFEAVRARTLDGSDLVTKYNCIGHMKKDEPK